MSIANEHKRINITLPKETITLLDRVAEKGSRSTFINTAVREYIINTRRSTLKQQLKEGAEKNAQNDLFLVDEWLDLEEEVWQGEK